MSEANSDSSKISFILKHAAYLNKATQIALFAVAKREHDAGNRPVYEERPESGAQIDLAALTSKALDECYRIAKTRVEALDKPAQ